MGNAYVVYICARKHYPIIQNTMSTNKLHRMSRVRPQKVEDDMDTIATSKRRGDRRAFDVLMEAQHHWNNMDQFGATVSAINVIATATSGEI